MFRVMVPREPPPLFKAWHHDKARSDSEDSSLLQQREAAPPSLGTLPGLEDQVPLLPTHLSQVRDAPGNPEIQGWPSSFLSPGPKHLLKRRNPLLKEHLANDVSGRGPGSGELETHGVCWWAGASAVPQWWLLLRPHSGGPCGPPGIQRENVKTRG